jgi:hypothetical protein
LQHAYPPYALRPLRACSDRPRRCAAEKRDELPPLQLTGLHPLPLGKVSLAP